MREAWRSFSSSNFKLQSFYHELKLFSDSHMASKGTLNVQEALEYLENLKVSSSIESDCKDEFVSEVRLAIVSPSKVELRETHGNSGEENGIDPNQSKTTNWFQMCKLNYAPHMVMFQLALQISLLTNLQSKIIKIIERKVKDQNW